METNIIRNEDCILGLKKIPDKSINLILTDPPYQSTDNEWDKEPDWNKLSKEFNRILKDNGTIYIFGKQPMLTNVLNSFCKYFMFRFELIWVKNAGMWASNQRPLQLHENIYCFNKKNIKITDVTWNLEALKVKGTPYRKLRKIEVQSSNQSGYKQDWMCENDGFRFPTTILEFNAVRGGHPEHKGHPTQKPEGLIRWLIKGGSNKGDVILDPYLGSGTTAICCKQLGRKYIGYELSPKYFKIATDRMKQDVLSFPETKSLRDFPTESLI